VTDDVAAGRAPAARAARRQRTFRRVLAFVAVSGTGWVLDVAVFAALVYGLGVPPFWANVISVTTAVVFVFSATHERVFDGPRDQRRRHLVQYALYQALLVAVVSVVLAVLLRVTGIEPVVGKVAVTPFTLLCNYVVLSRIARR
jgi:putative flippase GtrA